MQGTFAWDGPIDHAPKAKYQFWFTAFRLIIIIALMAGAATLVAIAFGPQYFTPRSMSTQLSCPPVVATQSDLETAQTGVTLQSTAIGTSDHVLTDGAVRQRPLNVKEAKHTSAAKNRPSNSLANGVSPKRTATAELTKRTVGVANQKKSKPPAPVPMLAQSEYVLSPFTDRYGQ